MNEDDWEWTPYWNQQKYVVREERMVKQPDGSAARKMVVDIGWENWVVRKQKNKITGETRWVKISRTE